MKRASFLLFFSAAVLLGQDLLGPDIEVPGQEMMSGEDELRSLGVLVRFKVMVSSTGYVPVKPWSSAAGLLDTRGGRVRRIQFDPHDGVWFGYDIAVAGDPTSGFLLTFGPPSANAPKDPGGNAAKVMSLRKYPAPQSVRDGDIVAIDLMVSADGTQKLTDYIQIISPGRDPEPPAATTTAEPRDFTVDDGPVTYNTRRAVVLWQGQTDRIIWHTGRPGATFWIAFPNDGRYILSLVPRDGFTKSGVVRDNVISFELNGEPCEIRFLTPVAGAGNAWNLYVMHDAGYVRKAKIPPAAVITGTGRLVELVERRD
jgi:hypothetical protein